MQDYRNDVYDAARGILGELTEEQSSLLQSVAQAVCIQMDSRLREGVSNADCQYAYILACALYAVSFLKSVSTEQLSSFTAGTVSLSFSQSASSLTELADRIMAPWLEVPTIFRGVRG